MNPGLADLRQRGNPLAVAFNLDQAGAAPRLIMASYGNFAGRLSPCLPPLNSAEGLFLPFHAVLLHDEVGRPIRAALGEGLGPVRYCGGLAEGPALGVHENQAVGRHPFRGVDRPFRRRSQRHAAGRPCGGHRPARGVLLQVLDADLVGGDAAACVRLVVVVADGPGSGGDGVYQPVDPAFVLRGDALLLLALDGGRPLARRGTRSSSEVRSGPH